MLSEPLDFGSEEFETSALELIGSEPPADTVASVRLISALNSRTTYIGAPVDAILTRPMFSSDRRLLFPAGSRLHGSVAQDDRGQQDAPQCDTDFRVRDDRAARVVVV